MQLFFRLSIIHLWHYNKTAISITHIAYRIKNIKIKKIKKNTIIYLLFFLLLY